MVWGLSHLPIQQTNSKHRGCMFYWLQVFSTLFSLIDQNLTRLSISWAISSRLFQVSNKPRLYKKKLQEPNLLVDLLKISSWAYFYIWQHLAVHKLRLHFCLHSSWIEPCNGLKAYFTLLWIVVRLGQRKARCNVRGALVKTKKEKNRNSIWILTLFTVDTFFISVPWTYTIDG